MPARGRILRGERWAEALQRAMDRPPEDAADWMEQHSRVLKRDRDSRVGLTELEGELCYLRFYRHKSAAQRLLFRLGRGRGVRAYDRARELAAAGIPVPEPRACLLVESGMMLVTEGVRGAIDLKALWQRENPPGEGGALLEAAGQALARLHVAGYAHGDCKWSNLLWSAGGFSLVDLEAVTRTAPGSRGQARDVARFTVNAEDLGVPQDLFERFLDCYTRHARLDREQVVEGMMPDLQRYRSRHRDRYGERGNRLL